MWHLHRPGGAVVTVLIAAALAGCATAGPGAPPPPPASCGEYTLDQGESIPQDAVDCMSDPGDGATLKVTAPTVEGDPIVTTYTAYRNGTIQVTIDATKDRYGGGTSIQHCAEAVSVLDLGECVELHEGD